MAGPVKAVGIAATEQPLQFLTFVLKGETFAVGTRSVREIAEYKPVTAVPMLPASILGVINLRGAAVPVLDLGIRFSGAATPVSRRSCIVVLEVAVLDRRQIFGILVDAVSEVLEIAPEDIEPAPSFGARIRNDFILGMGKNEQGFVVILDIEKVLTGEDLEHLEQAPAAAGA